MDERHLPDDASDTQTKRKKRKRDATTSPQLLALLERKEALEKSLLHLETQIYALETSYLEDTHARGNIIRGMEIKKMTQHLASGTTFKDGVVILLDVGQSLIRNQGFPIKIGCFRCHL